MNPALPPPATPGKWPSLALAALVHVLLLAFLFFGVRWQNPAPEAVEVSVVDGVPPPRISAPEPPPRPEPRPESPKPAPKPEPKPVQKPEPKPVPPPPVKPEIVTKPELKKPEKPEKKIESPKPVEKRPEPPVKQALPPKQVDLAPSRQMIEKEMQKLRDAENKREAAEMQRQLADSLAAESQRLATARAGAANKSALEGYINKIRVKVRGNIILPLAVSGNPEAVFLVNQGPDGTVIDIRLKKSSGNAALDAAIEKAIQKSSPLPPPDDPALFARNLEFKFRPLDD